MGSSHSKPSRQVYKVQQPKPNWYQAPRPARPQHRIPTKPPKPQKAAKPSKAPLPQKAPKPHKAPKPIKHAKVKSLLAPIYYEPKNKPAKGFNKTPVKVKYMTPAHAPPQNAHMYANRPLPTLPGAAPRLPVGPPPPVSARRPSENLLHMRVPQKPAKAAAKPAMQSRFKEELPPLRIPQRPAKAAQPAMPSRFKEELGRSAVPRAPPQGFPQRKPSAVSPLSARFPLQRHPSQVLSPVSPLQAGASFRRYPQQMAPPVPPLPAKVPAQRYLQQMPPHVPVLPAKSPAPAPTPRKPLFAPKRKNTDIDHPSFSTSQPMTSANCNAFMAAPSFGHAVNLGDVNLQQMGCTQCYACHKNVSAGRDYFIIHNVAGCAATYHSQCAKRWLAQFANPRNGHMSRPQCQKCRQGMNVKVCQTSRQNPLGFERFD